MRLEIQDWASLAAQNGALIGGGHVAARPILRSANRAARGIEHHHKAGQVFIDRSQTVVDPRTECWRSAEDLARVHHQHGRAVDRRIGRHRMQKGDVVDTFAQVGKQIADPLAALAILFEFPARFDDAATGAVPATSKGLDIDRLAIHADHVRLVVERIDMAWSAIHEQKNDALRFGGEMWRFGG